MDLDDALLHGDALVAAWDLNAEGDRRALTVFDVTLGAKPLTTVACSEAEVAARTAALKARGVRVGHYDGHRPMVWVASAHTVEAWNEDRQVIDAREGVLRDRLGRAHPIASIRAIRGYVQDDGVDRGLLAERVDGTRPTLCYLLSAHAGADPTYNGLDFLMDSGWIDALGSAIARWAGRPYFSSGRRSPSVSEPPGAYEAWLESLAQAAAGHELSYDAAAVRRLEPGVRARAETELLRRVEGGDVLAFETVALLGLQTVAPVLERHRDEGHGWVRSGAARALFLLRGDALAGSSDPLQRGLDAYALKQSDRPEAIPALLALLDASSVHARVHASEGLVQKLGLDPLAVPRGSPLRRMLLAICATLPTLWPRGAAELHHVLGAVHAGASPESLDLPYRPSPDPCAMARFWDEALGRKAFTVSNLVAMGPHDRAFAETVLVARLCGGDLHALHALRVLAVPGWSTHLRAALPIVAAHPEIHAAYESALVSADQASG